MQFFPVALFIMPHRVVLTFESVIRILKCDCHSDESYCAVLSSDTLYFVVKGGPNFFVNEILVV